MTYDLIVLTAHGRGAWLCSQLESTTWNYKIIDVSERLGLRQREDRLGPFGYFKDPMTSFTAEKWLDVRSRKQPQGFAIWTEYGLLEGQGALASHQWQQVPHLEVREILASLISVKDTPLVSSLCSETRLQSAYYIPTEEVVLFGDRVMRVGEGSDLEMSSQGRLKTFSCEDQLMETGVIVNLLTTAETSHVFPFTSGDILFSEPMEPKAVWMRASLDVQSPISFDPLPEQVLFVKKMDALWMEDNVWVLKKQINKSYFSVWVKTWWPISRDLQALRDLSQSVCGHLEEFFPHSTVRVIEEFTTENLIHKPPLYPVFDVEEWDLQKKILESGVIYSGPEKWRSYEWPDRIEHEKNILSCLQDALSEGVSV